uniref:L-histidine N(alpha)-methyltransferase n=1 Tax=Petrachloros mirabilis TaxID=2918835 RepID=UPI001EE89534|nr:L-histidine N(alpha)-methyltransferase [Petrachloros mirabilis]
MASRLTLRALQTGQASETDGADVIAGLQQTPKVLPSKYFYDDRGSQLFDQICHVPEYYLTRTEAHILKTYAPAIAEITGPCELVELGSGSATKTRFLLDAYGDRNQPLYYRPIDVSGGALKQSALALLQDYPTLSIDGLMGTYEAALAQLPPATLPSRMLCFLGSTLGNLSPTQCNRLFAQVREALQPGEFFLLGVDLQKSPQQIEPAYNDREGVTAAFNLNLLRHLNWRFQADFDLDQFRHHAFYNHRAHQIEMHLQSQCDQVVSLAILEFSCLLRRGETIRTEISRKFDLAALRSQLEHLPWNPDTKVFRVLEAWVDQRSWFGLLLCQIQS